MEAKEHARLIKAITGAHGTLETLATFSTMSTEWDHAPELPAAPSIQADAPEAISPHAKAVTTHTEALAHGATEMTVAASATRAHAPELPAARLTTLRAHGTAECLHAEEERDAIAIWTKVLATQLYTSPAAMEHTEQVVQDHTIQAHAPVLTELAAPVLRHAPASFHLAHAPRRRDAQA